MSLNLAEETGQTGACGRCGVTCRVRGSSNPEARLLKHADRPEGLCPNCAVTQFFHMADMAELVTDPQMLLAEHIQENFLRIMRAGNADLNYSEINWETVVANWQLPFPKKGRKSGGGRSAKSKGREDARDDDAGAQPKLFSPGGGEDGLIIQAASYDN